MLYIPKFNPRPKSILSDVTKMPRPGCSGKFYKPIVEVEIWPQNCSNLLLNFRLSCNPTVWIKLGKTGTYYNVHYLTGNVLSTCNNTRCISERNMFEDTPCKLLLRMRDASTCRYNWTENHRACA